MTFHFKALSITNITTDLDSTVVEFAPSYTANRGVHAKIPIIMFKDGVHARNV